jgi:hypothetical protein
MIDLMMLAKLSKSEIRRNMARLLAITKLTKRELSHKLAELKQQPLPLDDQRQRAAANAVVRQQRYPQAPQYVTYLGNPDQGGSDHQAVLRPAPTATAWNDEVWADSNWCLGTELCVSRRTAIARHRRDRAKAAA